MRSYAVLRFGFASLVAVTLIGCSGSDPPETSTAAAQLVFQLGGTLRLAGKVKDVKSPGELPPPPYQIERINLNESKVKETDLQKLAGMKSLRALSLYRADVGDEVLPHVVAIPNLQELELSYTRVTDKGLLQLKALPRLQKLFLYGTSGGASGNVTDNGVKTLQEEMPSLKVFR